MDSLQGILIQFIGRWHSFIW